MKKFLKIFLIILVTVIVLGGALCGGGYWLCKSTGKDFGEQVKEKDPQVLLQRAQSIAEFTMLPGLTLESAVSFWGFKFALFTDPLQTNAVILTEVPSWIMNINESNFKQKVNAQEIQKQLRQNGRNEIEIQNIKILEEGTLPTATKEVPYIKLEMAILDHKNGKTIEVEGILAVMDFTDPKKSIFFIAGSPMGSFNIDLAKEFLKTVKVT